MLTLLTLFTLLAMLIMPASVKVCLNHHNPKNVNAKYPDNTLAQWALRDACVSNNHLCR